MLAPTRKMIWIRTSGRTCPLARHHVASSTEPQRDHLFINYAWEDIALAEWLTFKLTGFGYRVWCDRIKLFGGESFPAEIDDAIKNRTFRFIALMSLASSTKPNPVKERTLALSIAKERGINFVIPLNLGLKPDELPWMLSDLTYVDFRENWASGLSQLLKVLEKAATPRPLSDGRERVGLSVAPKGLTKEAAEIVYSNVHRVEQIPDAIRTYRFNRPPRRSDLAKWPCFTISDHVFLAFHSPPCELTKEYAPQVIDANRWREQGLIEGIASHHIVSRLVSRSLTAYCITKGLALDSEREWLYFPKGLLKNDRLTFVGQDGKRNWVAAVGERGFFRAGKEIEPYRYHLSPHFAVRQDLLEGFAIRLTIHVYITDLNGNRLSARACQSRRKKVTHDWWNWEWLSRHLAVSQFLATSGNEIIIGQKEHERLILSARPLPFICPVTVLDDEIEERKRARRSSPNGASDIRERRG